MGFFDFGTPQHVIFEVVGRSLVRRSRVLKPLKFALSFVEHVLERADLW